MSSAKQVRLQPDVHEILTEIQEEQGIPITKQVDSAICEKLKRDKKIDLKQKRKDS